MRRVALCFICGLSFAVSADAQLFGPQKMPTPYGRQQRYPQQPPGQPAQTQMRKPAQLISKQAPMKINQSVFSECTQDNTHIVVSIPKQRAFLMLGDKIAIDAPISSGKRGHETPSGNFTVKEKDPNHHSNLYGDFVDSRGRIVRAGVSAQIDSAPSGTHFAGAAMKWFMRLTDGGVGMHIGILPGYPASHGCIRESVEAAKLFYDHAKVGTRVDVGDY